MSNIAGGRKEQRRRPCRSIKQHAYTLAPATDDEIFVRHWGQPNCDYLLPCFCEVGKISILVRIIWTAPKARRRGLATAMLKALNITSDEPLPDSMDFWRKVLPRLGGVAPVAPGVDNKFFKPEQRTSVDRGLSTYPRATYPNASAAEK